VKTNIWLCIAIIFSLGCSRYKLETPQAGADLSSYSVENCLYIRNSYGQIVSWKTTNPINFYISTSVPEKWIGAIKEAAQVWISPSGKPLINIKPEISSSTSTTNDNRNVIYWIDTGVLSVHQQGETITRWISNKIQDADILINSKDFVFYDETPENNYQIHLKSLLVHEFGHALGLKHADEVISVMYPMLEFVQVRIDLAQMDQTSVKCEYP
jgi:hypothetical protein